MYEHTVHHTLSHCGFRQSITINKPFLINLYWPSQVPVDTLVDHYERIHTHENIVPTEQYQELVAYLTDIANYQEGNLIPADLTRPSCPLVA